VWGPTVRAGRVPAWQPSNRSPRIRCLVPTCHDRLPLSSPFCASMAVPGEGVLRQRVCRCKGCNAVFWICPHCDRGQRYCSGGCRVEARRHQHRAANRRYQGSPEGRLDHRERQREYRRRHGRTRVTDQSSLLILSAAPLRVVTVRSMLITRSASTDIQRWAGKPWLRCVICGRSGLPS
jgi:hypothetical protein